MVGSLSLTPLNAMMSTSSVDLIPWTMSTIHTPPSTSRQRRVGRYPWPANTISFVFPLGWRGGKG
ncbi:hypothetical protein I7I50_00936 [Histoplasma capsulatum G186AR]|uniref:Uncharacterized protein n=1 Tax=Ajellomyces capsulatus TaxID=5037 RepID=A0A8H7YEN9_AJECA|nr:hypothetical protein I7I52_08202 [Histoplasma capsulatum]QSS72937.1 hypothetical protein I7I50_00936 [Histoplasma capsulatum G186AR]